MGDSEGAAVVIRSLNHAYTEAGEQKPVLKDINLQIAAHGTVALLGQSGSGKSTLLNLISGLEPVQTGHLSVFGHSVETLDDRARTLLRRRKIGFIYQSFNLVPTLTVGENIALPLTLVSTPPDLIREKIETQLKLVNLSDRYATFPDRLSGGEQQRVAIARALIHSPELLLADEPTGNLDAETGRQILDTLFATLEASSGTMILVTHSREVAQLADSRMTLKNGSVVSGDDSSAW